ncbi:DUF4832 domain-containing protein [Bacillus niameyensis]|uniref:DUF4832 domain-containing protein n=1 Tax=Bacillus niameyensis TaxID=1522308 RepID=UPI0007847F59|nr:DUF4832 domain-containing protein [Bacillus niameyensis]
MGKSTIAKPIIDKETIFRNPAMGWVLYVDAFSMFEIQEFPEAKEYWGMQDNNVEMANIFYLRVPWSIMEPKEGCYAWNEDDNFKLIIRMALDRGLKLAFRVYVDSKDAFMQATPQYVFEAGAKGYANNDNNSGYLTPYLNDPIFQEKLSNFVHAFSEEYDNPAIVDYIDAQGLGYWGEMHSVHYMTKNQKKQVFEWITNLYSECFKKVLLGQQYGQNSFHTSLQDWALKEKGYVIRRDSFGSPIWLKDSQKEQILAHWPEIPVFAENCYHGFKWREDWYKGDGYSTLHDMMKAVIKDAEELHANTLDLRYPQDATLWIKESPELVRYFALRCGYRLIPVSVDYPLTIEENTPFFIKHMWKNEGFGVLPNHIRNWNWKYKPSFALLDKGTGNPVFQIVDTAEPSHWVGNQIYEYETEILFDRVPSGEYDLAVAIVNRENESKPEIRLAIKNERTSEGWNILGSVSVQ